ncbi:MAG TPA: VOC family protein [bacterium]|nr:VOC family protein [bacterium]
MSENAPRVTGLGGVFFKAKDPARMMEWYRKHLGFPAAGSDPWQGDSYIAFRWRDEKSDTPGTTVWSVMNQDTDYFKPSESPMMLNYRVRDLHAVLAALRAEGVWVADKVDESELGKFGWIMDPEGNKIELWEPPAGA